MLQTFDFLRIVYENEELKNEILKVIETGEKNQVVIRNHILRFDHGQKSVLVAYDGDNPKFLDARITFDALIKMINKTFDGLSDDSITYI